MTIYYTYRNAVPLLPGQKVHFKKGSGYYAAPAIAPAPAPAPAPTPTPTPGTRIWPASFYTGPLGQNNMLPTGPGVYLASMFGGVGYTKAQQRAQIQARQAAAGRKYDVIHEHYDGSGTFGGVFGCEDPTAYSPTPEAYAAANGSEFMVAWTPTYTIAEMNAGKADAIWAKMGAYWSTLPQRVMVRAFYEFDNPNFAYAISAYTAAEAAAFQAAWKRMVDTIHSVGGTNVGFMWCPTEGQVGDRAKLVPYFPPLSLVDWVGSDWYNFGGWASPLHSGWASFEELFHYDSLGSPYASKYTQYAVAHGKPFMVGETATIPGTAGQKGQWFKEIPAAITRMPNCIGVSLYDEDVTAAEGALSNWFVDHPTTDPSCLAGWVAMAQDPVFRGRA